MLTVCLACMPLPEQLRIQSRQLFMTDMEQPSRPLAGGAGRGAGRGDGARLAEACR